MISHRINRLPGFGPIKGARHALAMLLFVAAASTGIAADTARDRFEKQVLPVLTEHCSGCHGSTKQKADLRLDTFEGLVRGGLGGAVIKPGDPGASRLVQAMRHEGEIKMPPKGPLTAELVAVVAEWIKGVGAQDLVPEETPQPGLDDADLPWSLRPVTRPSPPDLDDGEEPGNPIDRFIIARLKAEGLAPAGQADPRTLVRRLHLDVHGLPPDPGVVRAFAAAPGDKAWSALVNSTLDSPRYGERWARHWLDLVRFAETNGFEMNGPRPNAWPYRDYVIRAFNSDKPYDRFIFEQLAGENTDEPAATGYLVAGTWDEVKSPDRELTLNQRANELHDMVSTTGAAFLGLTVGCARCHDHKFDPISQRDYYSMAAVFAGVMHGEREIADPAAAERKARADALRPSLAAADAALRNLEPLARPGSARPRRAPVDARGNVERFTPVTARAVRFVIEATNTGEPCIDELEVFTTAVPPRNVAAASAGAEAAASGTYPGSALHKLEHINDGQFGNGRSWISNEPGRGWVEIRWNAEKEIDSVSWARDRDGRFDDRLATHYRVEADIPGKGWFVVADSADRAVRDGTNTEAVAAEGAPSRFSEAALDLSIARAGIAQRIRRIEQGPKVYGGTFMEPEPTRMLHRGDPMQPGGEVVPAGLSRVRPALVLPPETPEHERRVALARWITSRGNPLTARVIVNRIWQHHFGEGLVATPSDFGAMGAPPSHPELLDWLASELMDNGWSLKHIHRLILNSRAYRRSSAPDAGAEKVDAGARMLWRFPPRRLEAEPIRDAILWTSGMLDLTMGGPGYEVFEPNDNYVRVYNPKTRFSAAEWRRMIYQNKPRNQSDSTFGAFDCPEGAQPAPRRASSTTPLQALNLMNSPFIIQQAALFAQRLERECADAGQGAEIRRAYELAYGREPEPDEMSDALRLVSEHGLAAFCRVIFNSSEFLRIE